MSNMVTLHVKPGYNSGFVYTWTVSGGLADRGPWLFTVEESVTAPDQFVTISPVLKDVYHWDDNTRRIPDKNASLYYRVRLATATATYYSAAVGPWVDIPRRDYLIIKDVMRREVLHARTLAGTLGTIWVKNMFGPKCTVCIDPITGQIRNSKCPACMGTGYVPPYHGPYSMWMIFSVASNKNEFTEDGSGTYQDKQHSVRVIGSLNIRKGDIVVDPGTYKRYMVLATADTAELRRIPVVQDLSVSEMPTTDIVYRLTGDDPVR